MTPDDRGLGLRLPFPAHGAVSQNPAIIELCQCRIQRVKWLDIALQFIRGTTFQTETDTAVIPQQTQFRNNQTGAEFPIDTLDKAHHPARFIAGCHPDGIARNGRIWP